MSPLRPLANRMRDIQPFHVMEVMMRTRVLEAKGRSIIHMEIGEPDFLTPIPITEAATRAIHENAMHYTPSPGLPALRQAIATFYHNQYRVTIPASRIILTPGASGALLLTLGLLINPGDQVLMADPGYPCNRHLVHFVGGTPVAVPVDASTNYQLTPELVAIHWTKNTTAVLLASPSNPTGTLTSPSDLAAIAHLVENRGGRLIVDEIYHGLVYDVPAPTALAINDHVFVINSFSKYFNMTGWRLGWVVIPEDHSHAANMLQQNLFIAAATPAQYAALAAFQPETIAILESRRETFKRRRDYLLSALRALGFDIPCTPQGAFYLYANCTRFTTDSQAFALDILEQTGVAVTPGLDFGIHAPEKHVRFAYTTSLENLREGIRRLQAFLAR